MSSGPSLYRRHRPRTFADVVGQEPVVRTLRHAVQRGQVHHAYLFVGSRGTGKTSMAKILAACLNCERGPTVEPCGVCDSCEAIAAATSLDVIEMDAASNNSVDDIRDLRESVAYAPVSGRHKVYILDEAHMLSPQAWNAFLKTLEEPPPDTIFVLATTEAQKVLPTVVDRCHRFDFRRPTVEQIAGVIRRAAQAESVEIPPQAVALLARSATGSFRDALGTLEQLITYAGPNLSLDDVVAVLGVADSELLHEALDAVGAHDPRRALLAVARCVDGGRDPAGFVRDLEVHARELMVVQTLGGIVPPELSVTPDADERLVAQAQRVGRTEVVRLLDLLADALEALKAGADGRTQLELALIKAATPEVDATAQALVARIERLEAALAAAGASSSTEPAPPAEDPVAPAADPVPPPAQPAPPAPPDATAATPSLVTAASPPASIPVAPPATQATQATQATGGAPGPAGAIAVAAALVEPAALDLDGVAAVWPAVIEAVSAQRPLQGAVMAASRPVALGGGRLTVAFGPGAAFLRRQAEDPANRVIVAEALRSLTGEDLQLSYELRETPTPTGDPVVSSEEDVIARLKAELGAEELSVEAEPQPGPSSSVPSPVAPPPPED